MYTLYYYPGACSLAVHSVLEELELPVKLVAVDLRGGEHLTEDFRALNPAARVPVLVTDDLVLPEAPAILSYLALHHRQSELLPSEPRDQAQCLRWLNYASSRLHPAFSRVLVPQRFAPPEQARQVRAMGEQDVVECYELLEQALAGNDYITGSRIRLPDYLLYVMLSWDAMLSRSRLEAFPRTLAYRERIHSRPAVQRARAREARESRAPARSA